MAKYNITYNYTASIDVEVEANDEGEALHKGREIAEEADIRLFTIGDEQASQVNRME